MRSPESIDTNWITEAISGLPPLARVNEVSALLRVHPRTVRRLAASGRIRTVRNRESGGARLLFPRAAVAAYLESLTAGGAL